MTREEAILKMAELEANANELCKTYNEAFQIGDYENSVKIADQIIQAVNEYTSTARLMVYDECKESPDPMRKAVELLTFMTIAIKDEKVGEDKIPVRTIVPKERKIDLLDLDQYCNGIGHDKNWTYLAQKMNFLLTAQKAKDLGVDPKTVNDSYEMSNIARQMDMGKTPTSKTNLLRTLQVVITAMLGDENKAVSHDVNYLMSVYSKKGKKALSVSCANHRHFVGYLADICHRIVTPDAAYSVEFKAKKAD